MNGDENVVPKHRPSTRRSTTRSVASASNTDAGDYARPRLNLQTSDDSWHDKEFGLRYRMEANVRSTALAKCGT